MFTTPAARRVPVTFLYTLGLACLSRPDTGHAADALWNTVYLERAVVALRQSGQTISDEVLAHLY